MHIVLDISSLPYGTGVSVYTRELIYGLKDLKTEHKFTLLAGALKQGEFFRNWFEKSHLDEKFNLKLIPIPPKLQIKIWTQLNLLTPEFWVPDGDVYHSLDWSLGLGKKKTVLTVHDLFFWKSPELQKHPFESALKKRILKAKENNCHVIAISETTKNDLIDLAGYPVELIKVIYEAAPANLENIEKDKAEKIWGKYNLPRNYLIAVSTQEPRKNYQRLIDAYLESGVDMELVIVGKVGWGEELGSFEKIRRLGYVPDEDLVAIWQNAHALLYPSLYEGFGLPILQSFKLGVPVLTSNLGSMKEIADEAAILVDPMDENSIAEGIKKLVNMKEEEREELIEEGRKREKEFSWEKKVKKTLDVYEM